MLRAASSQGAAGTFASLTLTGPQLGIFDNSTSVPTTAFVQAAIQSTMATKPLNLGATGGGTYSFGSLGTGALIVYGSSGGVITSIVTIGAAGTNYVVGDLIGVVAGNNDATLRVLSVDGGGGVVSVQILYGGTGYPIFAGSNASRDSSSYPYTFTLSGTLTSNATFIMTNGSLLSQSNQWVINNNLLGAFTTTFFVSNGADAATGPGVIIPQGTANSAGTLIQTDGSTGMWLMAPPANFIGVPQNSQSANYTTLIQDQGKHIFHPTADNNPRTFTIDSNANVAYPIGTCITFVNNINTVTLAITDDTMTLAGTSSTGNRTLAAHGVATALKIGAAEWLISGTGIS